MTAESSGAFALTVVWIAFSILWREVQDTATLSQQVRAYLTTREGRKQAVEARRTLVVYSIWEK